MMEISKEKKEKKKRIVPIWVCILIFIGAFFAGMISKVAIKPAYRDAQDAPVPVVFTFGAVGPSCFYVEDWGVYGLDQNTEESRIAAANLFSVMGGVEITPEEIQNGSYTEKMKPISAAEWVSKNPIPTVVAYGTCDKVQPFLASLRLKEALEDNGVDYKYYELPHSGHGLQNDNRISEQWMESIDEYLNKYMPVN